MNLISKIRKLVKDNRKGIHMGCLGVDVDVWTREKLKNEGEHIGEELYKTICGERPDFESDEYIEWYDKCLLLDEILDGMHRRKGKAKYWRTPKKYETHFGPRD